MYFLDIAIEFLSKDIAEFIEDRFFDLLEFSGIAAVSIRCLFVLGALLQDTDSKTKVVNGTELRVP